MSVGPDAPTPLLDRARRDRFRVRAPLAPRSRFLRRSLGRCAWFWPRKSCGRRPVRACSAASVAGVERFRRGCDESRVPTPAWPRGRRARLPLRRSLGRELGDMHIRMALADGTIWGVRCLRVMATHEQRVAPLSADQARTGPSNGRVERDSRVDWSLGNPRRKSQPGCLRRDPR